jgi:hypothetical protein
MRVLARPAVDAGLACMSTWRETMRDHIEAIQRRLEGIIAEADSHISGNGSVLSYGMKIRRDTANEILGFVKSLARTAAADAPARDLGFDAARIEPSTWRSPPGDAKRNAEQPAA